VRKPFHRRGAPELDVLETFCVPKDCDNIADRQALPAWYHTAYFAQRTSWHQDYDNAVLECPNETGLVLWIAGAAIVGLLLMSGCLYFLCVAPKVKGQTMLAAGWGDDEDEDEGYADALEDE
jgi:hypothetical protein